MLSRILGPAIGVSKRFSEGPKGLQEVPKRILSEGPKGLQEAPRDSLDALRGSKEGLRDS